MEGYIWGHHHHMQKMLRTINPYTETPFLAHLLSNFAGVSTHPVSWVYTDQYFSAINTLSNIIIFDVTKKLARLNRELCTMCTHAQILNAVHTTCMC